MLPGQAAIEGKVAELRGVMRGAPIVAIADGQRLRRTQQVLVELAELIDDAQQANPGESVAPVSATEIRWAAASLAQPQKHGAATSLVQDALIARWEAPPYGWQGRPHAQQRRKEELELGPTRQVAGEERPSSQGYLLLAGGALLAIAGWLYFKFQKNPKGGG